MLGQVLKGVHCGVREVALKMLLNVEDADKELGRFTKVSCQSAISHSHCEKQPRRDHSPPCSNRLLHQGEPPLKAFPQPL